MKTTNRNARINGRTLAALLLMAGWSDAWADVPRVSFISHRGESLLAPENTMVAFREAVKRGADGFECDVYLTKDNEIVCLHDTTAKRTGGLDVKPRDATLAELRALDAGAWKDPKYAGERMPTLAEALSLAHERFEIYVEIKCGVEIVPRLAEVMAAEPKATPERVVFICFSTNVVAAVRERFPAHRAYWLTGTGPKKNGTPGPTAAAVVAAAKACGASGVDAQDSASITPDFVETVKAAGLSFHVWTVNRARRSAELAAVGVETITSDCGGALVALLKPRPKGPPVIRLTFDGAPANCGSGGPLFDAELAGQPAYVAGVCGQALALDGTNGVASVAYPLPECGTLSLWYRPDAFYDFNMVFDNARSPDLWEMWINKSGRLRFRMGKGAGEVSCDLRALGGTGRWHHLALAWDSVGSNVARLYVDGAERASSPIGAWVAPGGAFAVGGGNRGNMKGRGAADDVRVYEEPLSAAQIRALFEARGTDLAAGGADRRPRNGTE